MARITAANSASAEWIDPVTGEQQLIGNFPTSGSRPFTRPASWQDGILVVKAVEARSQKAVEPAAAVQK
jgi:hypothetical protein